MQHGFHATGMAEICVEAGMSPGNLYRYFQNKAAIIQSIADETRTRILPVLEELKNHTDPVEGIVQIILHSVREFCKGPDGRLWVEILAEASRNEDIRKLCMTFDLHIRSCLKGLLRRVAETNALLLDVDIEATSLWLIALLDGAIARFSMDPDADLARTLETLAGSIRRWLRAQPVCEPA
jgi:AcrR family transcriptional regulator